MRKGFTLIEVMLAAAILGIGALGVLGMLTTVIRQNGVTQDRTAATYLAESVVTRIELGAKLKWSAPAGNTDYPEWGMVRKAEMSPGTWLSATHQVDKTGVVSSDAAIQNTVFGGGVDRMSANGFSRAVAVNAHEFHLDESPKTAVKNTVAERLGGDTVAKLKALRDSL